MLEQGSKVLRLNPSILGFFFWGGAVIEIFSFFRPNFPKMFSVFEILQRILKKCFFLRILQIIIPTFKNNSRPFRRKFRPQNSLFDLKILNFWIFRDFPMFGGRNPQNKCFRFENFPNDFKKIWFCGSLSNNDSEIKKKFYQKNST